GEAQGGRELLPAGCARLRAVGTGGRAKPEISRCPGEDSQQPGRLVPGHGPDQGSGAGLRTNPRHFPGARGRLPRCPRVSTLPGPQALQLGGLVPGDGAAPRGGDGPSTGTGAVATAGAEAPGGLIVPSRRGRGVCRPG